MLFVGHDWADDHHDVALMDEAGALRASARLAEGLDGVAKFHELVAEHAADASEVVIGTETDRGLCVAALVAAGYWVYALNPKSVDRYRDRQRSSGAKSDQLDARVLADLVRTDRHLHRPVAADSAEAEGLKVLTRTHKDLIWRRQGFVNQLRALLRDYFPGALRAFGNDLASTDAVTVLLAAPSPDTAARLTSRGLTALLRKAGRKRGVEERAQRLIDVLREETQKAPAALTEGYAIAARSLVTIIGPLNAEIAQLEDVINRRFEQHPQAKIYTSLPALGGLLGARALAEFGDDPGRYINAKSRKNYAGCAPVTRQSGKMTLVSKRTARNQRLADTSIRWAFCSLQHSPGARAYYDALRRRGKTHYSALSQVANRWVGILHGCLASQTPYDEQIAWGQHLPADGGVPTAA